MVYLLWFLSILISLTAKQIAEVALELISREITKARNHFLRESQVRAHARGPQEIAISHH